jgi:hypothetical protein
MQKCIEKQRSIFFSPIRINSINIPNKTMNIIDFINQKDKFKIQSEFDEKGARNFLLSKEKAMMEIQLNDDESQISNYSNNNTLKEEKRKTKKTKTKKYSIENSKQASPRKKKGKSEKNKDLKKVKTEKISKIKNNKYFSKIDQNDSIDPDHLYKFIIENADESEEIFMKKLSKEIKIVQNNKNKGKDKDKINKKIYKSVTNDKLSLPKTNKLNPFYFSETAKNLMNNENIEISNIKNDNTIIPNKSPIITPVTTNPTCYTSNKHESNKKNIFSEKETVVKNNGNLNIDINDKISLMSILSDLM